MDYRPSPDLCGGCAAMRIPTAISPDGGVARPKPAPREGQAGPSGWRMGPQYWRRRVTPVEGRGPELGMVWNGGKACLLANV